MVLGGGDGSKPSVSFLNIEPKVSMFPRPEQKLFWSFHHGDHYRIGDFVALFFVLLLYRLATDIGSVEEAFCIWLLSWL